MNPEGQLTLRRLPGEVNAFVFSKLVPADSVVTRRHLDELVHKHSIAHLDKEWAYELAREKRKATEIDAINPFQNVRWVQGGQQFIDIEKTEIHSVLSSENEESLQIRQRFAGTLIHLIKCSGEELRTIKLPLVYEFQTSILESLIQYCPNISEIHVTDLYRSNCSNRLAELLRDSSNIRKFVCDYPSENVIDALCSTESKIDSLELSNTHISLVERLSDALECHANTLKSLTIHRIGWYGPKLDWEDVLEASIRAEQYFVCFLCAKEFPQLRSLKLAMLGNFESSPEGWESAQRFPNNILRHLHQKFSFIDEFEMNLYGYFSWRAQGLQVMDLGLSEFVIEENLLHHIQGFGDAEVSSACSEDDSYPVFDLDQDDYENVNLNPTQDLLCRSSRYCALRSIFVDINAVLLHFFRSKVFRKHLRKLLFASASSLQYVAFSDEWQQYQTAYSRLCRLMACVVSYCKNVSHVRFPSLVVEKLDGQSALPHWHHLRTVFDNVQNLQSLQISSPYHSCESSAIDMHQRVGDFLRNWPMFLKVTARAMPQLKVMCVLFEAKRSDALPRGLESALVSAMKATKEFEAEHQDVDMSEVKGLFEVWLNEMRRNG